MGYGSVWVWLWVGSVPGTGMAWLGLVGEAIRRIRVHVWCGVCEASGAATGVCARCQLFVRLR